MSNNLNALAQELQHNVEFCSEVLSISTQGCSIRVHSNSHALLEKLKAYFAHVVTTHIINQVDIDINVVESPALDLSYPFIDWRREPDKSGRKDAYFDMQGGRLLLKVRTGMIFLQSVEHKLAIGPCLEHDNQVINFINAQYMNWLQHRNWLMCHASAVVHNDQTLAISAFSGGGKSTLMLHLLDQDEVAFLTNDRLFIRQQGDGVGATGIPKLPRINPGTIVNNPKLAPMISEPLRKRFLSMPIENLWQLEDKYDVDIDKTYGQGRIAESARLKGFLVLNWQRNSTKPLTVKQVNLEQRKDLISPIMKSPGPFYQYSDGHFLSGTNPPDRQNYIALLHQVPVYEISGAVDFPGLASICKEQIL